ncbi:MAG: serine esterase [Bdellovibrio sp. CG10_big_fil_rev_8_21_14_0_10_47_8]|nr:MAG: serine esterase [Bdellovibrio sp. CG10_big_fil_rev_8_21_14_0_10_47_8]
MIVTDLFKSRFILARRPSEKLMVVLHGKGDSIKPFLSFDEELRIPEMNYLLLNAPRKYSGGFSWYGDPPFQKDGVLKTRKKMFHLLQELELQGWKPENIFLFGFSQGCLVSADIAMNYPKKLGGVVGISGYFHFFPRWKRNLKQNKQTPWLLTHGSKDDVLPIDDTKFGVEKLRSAGLKVDFIESKKKHVLEEREYPLIRRWVEQRTR